MFKLPALPTPTAAVHDLADFAELLAIQNVSTSAREILAYLSQVGENYPNDGADDQDDVNASILDDVFSEMYRRSQSCAHGYPFRLDMQGTVLRHIATDNTVRADVYRYLLLSTRLNMNENKVQDGVDGTGLLEELAALVMRCYLGYERAKSFVFGTAAAGGFQQKVSRLCNEIGEGGSFSSIDTARVNANDDKLDAVAWLPFTDGRAGKVIIFCQCKTGTSWRDQTTQLQPQAFIKRWTSARHYVLEPLRAYCVSESTDPSRWESLSFYAGLLFDRMRIIDFLDESEDGLHQRVRQWNAGACMVAKQAIEGGQTC
jgi:hypothetical protein